MKSANSYLHTYTSHIAPKLREIDTYIKTSSGTIPIAKTAQLLCLSEDEVATITRDNNITNITRRNFFTIMAKGSSFICGLFRRETERGSPYVYTRADIAYIYMIDPDLLNATCDALGIHEVTDYTLPDLLAEISIED